MSGGSLFVISAPSGAGKTTLLKRILATVPNLAFSVSHTTRQPRQGEVNGRDYHFVERAAFEAMRRAGDFLEWAEVHGNLYGTSRHAVESQRATELDVLLDIDVQGAAQIRNDGIKGVVFIFIAPPSHQELERRLRGRGTDSEETVMRRLANAYREMAEADRYDYLVINDRLFEAQRVLAAIVVAERCRARRDAAGVPFDLSSFAQEG